MRRLGLGLLATTALAAWSAEALAGPGVNPLRQVPVPQFDPWMGWYAGGTLGGSWGRAQSNFAVSVLAAPAAVSNPVNPDGVIGGGQLGYNWELNPNWLIGAEADIQGSGEKADGRFAIVDTEGVSANYEAKIEWFGTIRGRFGYIVDRRLLLYATGGLAYGRVSLAGTASNTVVASVFSTAFSSAAVNAGWTAGGGVEGVAWDPRWTWKVEYLYLDLGALNSAAAPEFATIHASTKFTDQVVRGGLNFHF